MPIFSHKVTSSISIKAAYNYINNSLGDESRRITEYKSIKVIFFQVQNSLELN